MRRNVKGRIKKMEIYLQEFHKKFTVRAVNRNMEETYKIQLKLAQAAEIDGKEPIEQIRMTMDLQKSVINYLIKILKLEKNMINKINNEFDFDQTVDIANHVALRLMGLTEEDIKKANDEDKDEKK